MTCPTCNANLTPDAHFCTHCGAPAAAQPRPAGYVYPGTPPWAANSRVNRHLQALGILWLVYAVLRFFTGLFGMVFLHALLGRHVASDSFNLGWTPLHHSLFSHLWPVALTSLLVSLICASLTAFALLTRQPWGRIFAIIFAILALIHLPFGTLLGIYTLWVLAPTLSGDQYATLAYARHGA